MLVAGSVGPYGAMLADGSEYRGDYDPGDAALEAFHRPRIDALVAAGADLLAVETIPTVREARVLVRLLDETGVPAWISYTGRDGATTAAGEPFAEAIALAGSGRDVVAVGVNCTAPQHMRALLKIARRSTDLPLIAYPNRGDTWDPEVAHVAQRQGRDVGSRRRRLVDGPRGRVARRLLRHPTGRYRATGRSGAAVA